MTVINLKHLKCEKCNQQVHGCVRISKQVCVCSYPALSPTSLCCLRSGGGTWSGARRCGNWSSPSSCPLSSTPTSSASGQQQTFVHVRVSQVAECVEHWAGNLKVARSIPGQVPNDVVSLCKALHPTCLGGNVPVLTVSRSG